MRRPTIKDVAEHAKVSLKTVSRVINNEPSVMQATRARVLRAVAEAWHTQRERVDGQGDRLAAMLNRTASLFADGGEIGSDTLDAALQQMRAYFDEQDGGFGSQPKFPQPMTLDFALTQYRRTGDLERADARAPQRRWRPGPV